MKKDLPIFIRIFGNTPKIRILNYLLKGRGLDYSMSDITRNSNIGWTTLNRLWDEFIENKIVVYTRDIGKAKLYKLNEENPVVKELIHIYKLLLMQETENYFSKKVALKH